MKIGVISDTHIPNAAEDIPEKIWDDFKEVDLIIHAGDLVDSSFLDKLKNTGKPIKAVWGNMDSPELKKKLPAKEIIEIKNYKIGVMHGWGHPNNLVDLVTGEFRNNGINIIIFGHSHSAFNVTKNGILYFNPGSPTDKIYSPYNTFGIIEIREKLESRIVRL